MKKLMFICSLAFTFLLGVQEVSAQYVPTDQATIIVRNEINSLSQVTPTVTTGSLSAVPQVSNVVRLKQAFLGMVLEDLLASPNAEVQGAIDAAFNTIAVGADANNPMVIEVKEFTQELLED